jgi:hypothetical protein
MFYCLNIRKKEIDAAKIVIIWELGKLGGRCQVSGDRCQGLEVRG